MHWNELNGYQRPIGLAHDGEAFVFAWEAFPSFEHGNEIQMTRFNVDGGILTEPTMVARGWADDTRTSGLAWTGTHFVLGYSRPGTNHLTTFDQDGSVLDGWPVEIGLAPFRQPNEAVHRVVSAGGQLFVDSTTTDLRSGRFSADGRLVSSVDEDRASWMVGNQPHGPFPVIRQRFSDEPDDNNSRIEMQLIGCPGVD